ncbi:dUTP diphosphatase [Lysinibacillus fusiformis]|nr:dUTP diphosphatase [Lysinibacillus fusiformis]
MNLTKLFETQATLDEHIMQEHPELRGQNNLDWKLLALQVELGECANEWRGFKKWSKDQEPRVYVPNPEDLCEECNGEGYFDKHKELKDWIFCKNCDGCGCHFYNPLLEEYVDCLHFILSIGVEKGYTGVHINLGTIQRMNMGKDPLKDFGTVFGFIHNFKENPKHHWYDSVFEGFINLGIALGFAWNEVEEAYYAKNRVNHERQNAGY